MTEVRKCLTKGGGYIELDRSMYHPWGHIKVEELLCSGLVYFGTYREANNCANDLSIVTGVEHKVGKLDDSGIVYGLYVVNP